jgi:transposase
MYQIKLSVAELKKITQLQESEKSPKVLRRLEALKLLNQGQSHTEIAEALNITIDTVTDWIKIYNAEKLAGLCKLQFTGKRKSKINDYVDKIKQDIKDNTITTLAELQDWIKDKYSIEMEQSWLFRCCKKNSICLTRKLV